MDDYLSEKEQWEAIRTWLRENGLWIIAGVAVGAAGIFGWQWWKGHLDKVSTEASARYEKMMADFGRGDRTAALTVLGEIERDYGSTPYADQAKLAAARAYVESNELDKAAAQLQAVEGSKDKQLGLIARLRLARVQIAQNKPDDALTTLSGVEPGAFAPRFHEVRGDAELAKGNKSGALSEYRQARSMDSGSGVTDTSLLDLKISDLVAAAGPAPAPTQAAK